jgi:hypothetical protein
MGLRDGSGSILRIRCDSSNDREVSTEDLRASNPSVHFVAVAVAARWVAAADVLPSAVKTTGARRRVAQW